MYIDKSKEVSQYIAGTSQDAAKTCAADHIKDGNTVLDYSKVQESYYMTENGSYYMPDAVYQKPGGKEEKTIIEELDNQVDMSAANRKNQMVVVSNTRSAEDLEEMSKEGFDAMDTDSHTIITVTDKIKAVLAKAGVDISIYGDSLSMEQLEEITGSTSVANQIAAALKQADLPATDENIEETEQALQTAAELTPLDDAAKEYLLRNEWEPTIANIYKSLHSGIHASDIPTNSMKEIDFSELEKQIRQIIKDAGLEDTKETREGCEWLIQKNIGLTVRNIKYLNSLNGLSKQIESKEQSMSLQQVVWRIMEAIRDGKRPMDALLTEGFSYEDRAKAAMDTITNAADADIAYCIEGNISISVENLQVAMANRGEEAMSSVRVEISASITFVTAKRQLEETRLMMTTEANYALLKRGISIDTKPLEQVIENLKGLEDQYYKDMMQQSGVVSTEENTKIFRSVTKYVEEIKFQPAYALTLNSAEENIENLYQRGSSLKTSMESALQSYEIMWTSPRSDMGDSISKAFGNIDDILQDLDMESSSSNRRAVRILAYNKTEITAENITRIKETDLEVQKLFRNLTPSKTLELIREGKNPLDMEISELNRVIENLPNENQNDENEKFSKFLWKLEKKKEISAEEKESYIGIYRLMAQVEKTDGAAIGALLNQGTDITMRNLLTAVRSAKKSMDYIVDDAFDGVNASVKGARIDHQILSAYQTNCAGAVMDLMSPEKLEQITEWEDMTPEQLMEALREVQTDESAALEQEYYAEMTQEYNHVIEASDDVYAFLEKYDVKNSARNVFAASRLLDNPSNVFDTLFQTEGRSDDYKEMIAGLKAQVLENFSEAVKTPEEMTKAQATLAEVAERVMQTMIIENETVSVKDLKDLRLMNQQFYLCDRKSQEESFLVPVETGDSVTGVNLKIVRGKEDKGLVDIFFRGALMEKVAASFEAKETGITGVIATTDRQTKALLEKNLDHLIEKMNTNPEESMNIQVVEVESLSAWQFEKNTLPETGNSGEVQTKRLYHIAESFIQSLPDLI